MRRKSLWIGAAMVLIVAAALVGMLAGFSGNAGAAQDLEPQGPPPGGGECICPANWDPVVCKGSDGSRHTFSNGCVAGCNGYTNCSKIQPAP